MLKLDLAPLTQLVSLDVDGDTRTFLLREHSPKKSVEFLKLFDSMRAQRERLLDAPLLEHSPESWEEVSLASDALYLWLLKGREQGVPVDPEWVGGLTVSQRRRLLDTQTTLNQIEAIGPNLLAALAFLEAARLAAAIVQTGETSGAGGKSASPSELPTASTPGE